MTSTAFRCDGRIAGDHPPAGSAAARVPAQARRTDGRYRQLCPAPAAKQKKSLVRKYSDYGAKAVGDLKKDSLRAAGRVEELHEFNPMLGHRGCRLGITYPEITEMQARAIFEAAVAVDKEGIKTHRRSDDPADRDGERNGEPGGDCQARGGRSLQRKRTACALPGRHHD